MFVLSLLISSYCYDNCELDSAGHRLLLKHQIKRIIQFICESGALGECRLPDDGNVP